MGDQAAQLRQLMWRTTRQPSLEPAPVPRCVTVLGGERNVGCTSVAIELASSLVEQGARVVLVDLDPVCSRVAERCGCTTPSNYSPAVAHRDIHEALQLGPRGILWVPGVWESYPANPPETKLLSLLKQLAQLGRHADWVVLDAGNASGFFTRILGNFTDLTLFVTSPLVETVTRTYTLLKKNVVAGLQSEVGLFVNHAESNEQAEEVVLGFQASLRKFLTRDLAIAGTWLNDASALERQAALHPLAAYCVESVAPLRNQTKPRRAA
jgi:MinD-like ATPase involved in chromosome partitioning or flagellar assembly